MGKARGHTGPRSKLVEAIAVLLLSRPMRAAEIAQVLGYPTRYISSYLSYWRVRGFFDYADGFWQLTPRGEEFARQVLEREIQERVQQYVVLAKRILSPEAGSEQVRPTRNNKAREVLPRYYSRILSFTATETSQRDYERQRARAAVCLRDFVLELGLTEEESEVLLKLIDHYAQWGSTYLYLDQLERELGADTSWLMSVIRNLQSKGLVYIYSDRRLGVRVGFSRRLREVLELCSSRTVQLDRRERARQSPSTSEE